MVFAVTFAKEANERVEFVLTQTLSGKENIIFIVTEKKREAQARVALKYVKK